MTKDSTVYRAGYPTPMTVKEITPLGIIAKWTDDFGEQQKAIFDPKELRTRKPAQR